MKFICVQLLAVFSLFVSCSKSRDQLIPSSPQNTYVDYIVKKGEHYVSNNIYKPVEVSQLNFMVQFDSSAVYQTIDPVNQYDINKLYGFADNNASHHQYSARFGWAWNDKALRLYAYVYNDGKVTSKELGPVQIGIDHRCSIKIDGNQYVFTVNDHQTVIQRSSTTAKAKGYLLYPYFGGDEVAPHDVHIRIKDL